MADEETIVREPVKQVIQQMEPFRGVREELETLYKICNGGGNKALEQRVDAAYTLLNLGFGFLDEFPDEADTVRAIRTEMEGHPYPKLQRSMAKTADGVVVVRLQPVRAPTTGDVLKNDVLPQYLVQGEALVITEMLRDFYLHHVQKWVQTVAYALMKHDILRAKGERLTSRKFLMTRQSLLRESMVERRPTLEETEDEPEEESEPEESEESEPEEGEEQ